MSVTINVGELRKIQNKVNFYRINHGQEPFADDQVDEIIDAFAEISKAEDRLKEITKNNKDSHKREFQALTDQCKNEFESGISSQKRYGNLLDDFTDDKQNNKSQFSLSENRETKRYGNILSQADELDYAERYARFETLYKMTTGREYNKNNVDYEIAHQLLCEAGLID